MQAHHLYILTGASRGMGLAMARQLLHPDHLLLCISRQTHEALAQAAQATSAPLIQWAQDLVEGQAASERLHDWLQSQNGPWLSATLINNAALIPRVAPLDKLSPAELSVALRVGLEAPMQLSAVFLQDTLGKAAKRKVLNISSGLGRRAMASQTAYCAVKAGLDHFTRCLALEQALQPEGATVCSLAPGVIDTDMQTQLRNTPSQDFPDQAGFAQLQAQGMLTSPDAAAARVLAWLARDDFGAQPVADVREG